MKEILSNMKNLLSKLKRKKLIIGIIIILIIICVVCVFFYTKNAKAKKRKESMKSFVSTEILKKRDINTSISVTGTIASADKREVTTNLNEAEVTEVSVSVGDYVEEGATIIVFDDSDLEDELETTKDENELSSLKQQKNRLIQQMD